MAGAVQVFKDSMIARERAEAEITQQRADSERRRLEREARGTAAGEEIAALVNRVAEGDLSGRVDESGKDGFFLSASQQLHPLTANLHTMAGDPAAVIGAIAVDDIGRTVRGHSRTRTGQLKRGGEGQAA